MPTPDPIIAELEARAHAAGREHERAATVAWIRSYAAALPQHKQAAASGIADAIGRGEHATSAAQTAG